MIRKDDMMLCIDRTFHNTIGKSYKVVKVDKKRSRWYYRDDNNVLEYWHTDSSLTARCFQNCGHSNIKRKFREFVRSVL